MRRTLIFVLGVARSGTSALTRTLSLCGAALPPRLLGASKAEPKGCWEPRSVLYINNRLLRSGRTAGFDLSPRLSLTQDQEAAAVAEMVAYLSGLPPAPVTICKDPKMVIVADRWLKAARCAGFNVAAVISVRSPQEFADSFGNWGFKSSKPFTLGLWLKYNLLAERQSRDLPRAVVDYAALLDDPEKQIRRVTAALDVDLHFDQDAVYQYLDGSLNRHRREIQLPPEPFGARLNWVADTWAELSAASRDEEFSHEALDRVFEEYTAAEHGFRAAHADQARYWRVFRRAPIPLLNGVTEMTARRQLRRGDSTWK